MSGCPGACVRATTLRGVITEALADAERTGMTGRVRDEWVSIAILASSVIPLHSHFPPEGGGPCPWCDTAMGTINSQKNKKKRKVKK